MKERFSPESRLGANELAENLAHLAGEDRFREEDFADVFGADEVKRDRATVAAAKKKFAADLASHTPSERAMVERTQRLCVGLETVIVSHAESSNWFGETAFVRQTSEFDDIVNGVDAVVEFDITPDDAKDGAREAKHLALAIDASTDPSPERLTGKMQRNLKKICGTGRFPEVKYFASQVTDDRGRLGPVIPVVIGLEVGDELTDLMTLVNDILKLQGVKAKNDIQRRRLKENLKSAAEHPAQKIFLEEISAQLAWYAHALTGLQKEQTRTIAEELQSITKIIRAVLASKRGIKLGALHEDRVYNTIVNFATMEATRKVATG